MNVKKGYHKNTEQLLQTPLQNCYDDHDVRKTTCNETPQEWNLIAIIIIAGVPGEKP